MTLPRPWADTESEGTEPEDTVFPIFALPLPPWLQPHYARKKRRNRPHPCADTESEETTQSVSAGNPLTLTPNESHQYRVAGLPLDHRIPGGDFPHGPAEETKLKKVKHKAKSVSRGSAKGLDLQHLAALNAVLHRCLKHGDYHRAGRAWGLLLRENFRGFPIDVRHAGTQIGELILLHRGVKHPGCANEVAHTPATFTIKGFAEAKVYYERLILAHPYSKSARHMLSALHFYPVMFEHWILVAQEDSGLERNKIEKDEMSDEEDFDYDDRAFHKKQTRISAVRAQELEQARQISIRIDALLATPPYSDSAKLLEIRGMVSVWIGDLLISSLEPTPFQQGAQISNALLTDGSYSSYERQLAQSLAVEKRKQAEEQRQLEIGKARDFLQQAKRRGVECDLDDPEEFLGDSEDITHETSINTLNV
ncbi:hypothetical protein N7507_007102 [Penicillium longicatenatum]|nr:hypothetical protein N7507_007102 [Penicillium longicatenatum]